MTDVAVLIPVLNRPHRVEPLLASLEGSTGEHPHRAVFLCSPGDEAEIAAVRAAGLEPRIVPWQPEEGGDWGRKCCLGFEEASEEWVLLGADDLLFHDGWFEEGLRCHEETSACVIGTNDLHNTRVVAGHHATHPLVHRDYGTCGTIDDPSKLLHCQYQHWFIDDEFCQTAQWRGEFAHAREAVVEHLHPVYGSAPDDETYRKGQASVQEDRLLYESRKRMWGR